MKKQIGNLLIILGLILFIYTYYPLVTAYLPISDSVKAANSQLTITIPKINASADIVPNVDSQNEAEYDQALKKGVAEAKGFATPGQGQLVYLFAHSSLPPWEMTRT